MEETKNKGEKIVLLIFLLVCSALGIAAFTMSFTKKCGEGFKEDKNEHKNELEKHKYFNDISEIINSQKRRLEKKNSNNLNSKDLRKKASKDVISALERIRVGEPVIKHKLPLKDLSDEDYKKLKQVINKLGYNTVYERIRQEEAYGCGGLFNICFGTQECSNDGRNCKCLGDSPSHSPSPGDSCGMHWDTKKFKWCYVDPSSCPKAIKSKITGKHWMPCGCVCTDSNFCAPYKGIGKENCEDMGNYDQENPLNFENKCNAAVASSQCCINVYNECIGCNLPP